MDVKAKLEEYLDEEDLLYIDIYLKNGVNLHLIKPLDIGTLNLDLEESYFTIYGAINNNNRIDTSVPYTEVLYVSASFGIQEGIVADASGNTMDIGGEE